MSRVLQLCSLPGLIAILLLSSDFSLLAQAPVGTISGVVADESGAVIPNATVIVRNKATGFERQLNSASDGSFNVPALAAGVYEVRVEAQGFRTLVREATVEVGLTTTADARLSVGQTTEIVNVEAATAQIEYEKNAIDGVVTRQTIEGLPLNGRSFIQLASIEPGVTVSPGTTAQYNALFSVSVLGGSSGKTAINVDGGNIRNAIEGGIQMNFSQEVVQEFQLSSVNFDLSTDITGVGAINVVTRQGGNTFHGSGYFYFRDHNMAAYPGLARDPNNLDPFFARRNPGFWVGGPVLKDRLFFFFNYEYMNQVQAYTVHPDLPSVAGLAGTYQSPYKGKTLSVRFDYKLSSKHSIFARYSHDGNNGFGPNGGAPLPSNWLQNVNWSDQTVFGMTSVLTPSLVNDFRFTYGYWHNRNLFADSSDCPNCLGLGGEQIQFAAPSSNFTVGNTENATQGRDLRRFPVTDQLSWQKGHHRFRFGGEIDHEPGTGFWGYCDPGCAEVFAPEFITATLGAAAPLYFPNLPKTISTNQDLLNLPFAGAEVGIGDPSQPPPYNIDKAKSNNRYRVYAQDTWKLTPKFTLNYGLAWEFESTLVNNDLTRPQFLAPLYGNDLSPTNNNYHNFSPSLGFAWNVGHDNKTVVRGGAGIYYDTTSLYNRLQERSSIGPVGNGRILYPSTSFLNIFPNIVNLQTGKPIPIGQPLQNGLTTMTLGQWQTILAQQGPAIAASLTGNSTDLSVREIDITKTGTDLYLKNYPVQRSYQMSIGMQREVRRDLVVTADFVRRVFVHVDLGAVDLNKYNRYINGVQTPVIPICPASEASTPGVECSNGPITFWQPVARSTYTALLLKADKRFAHRFQFTASYALQSQMGINGVQDLSNYDLSWGPSGPRHVLSIVGIVDLPWGFQLGLVSTTSSRGPIMINVSGTDLNGNGSGTTPLPGLSYNCINISCGWKDVAAAIANWNATYAGKKDGTGKTIPVLQAPTSDVFGRPFNSQDLRLTKTVTFRERYKFSVFAEMFNVLNYSNLSGYNYSPLATNTSFGLPTQRATQVFGSGGPRAVQIGGRFTF